MALLALRPFRNARRAVWLVALSAVASCGGTNEPTVPATGNLEIAATGLPSGASPRIAITGPGGFNQTVTAAGNLESLTPGTYTLAALSVAFGGVTYEPSPASQTVTVSGGKTATSSVTYAARPAPIISTLAMSINLATIQVGQTTAASVVAFDQYGALINTGTVTWSSSAPQVATVNASGNVLAVSAGRSTITATAGEVSSSAQLTVLGPNPPSAPLAECATTINRDANRLKSRGDVRVSVIFVDFPDAPATRRPQDVFSNVSPTAENFYKAVSYNQMHMILEPNYVWLRMSKRSTEYSLDQLGLFRDFVQEALNLASSVDFSRTDAFVVVGNPDAGVLTRSHAFVGNQLFGVTVGGKTLLNGVAAGRGSWDGFLLDHELGHTLGLADLYAENPPTSAFGYTGGFSLMSKIADVHSPEYFAWERWRIGWIDDEQVYCTGVGTSEVVLSPIERAGGTKMVAIPTSRSSMVIAESRRTEGFDTNRPGVLVYFLNGEAASGDGLIKVLPIDGTDSDKRTATLDPGGSITFNGVTVTFLSTNANGDRVRVVR